jgi:hypothetical protein
MKTWQWVALAAGGLGVLYVVNNAMATSALASASTLPSPTSPPVPAGTPAASAPASTLTPDQQAQAAALQQQLSGLQTTGTS